MCEADRNVAHVSKLCSKVSLKITIIILHVDHVASSSTCFLILLSIILISMTRRTHHQSAKLIFIPIFLKIIM